MTRILVTGCSGYIGSHLCAMLNKNNNYIVHGLDKNEPQAPLHKFYKLDINNDISSITDEYDAVIHLAALVNVGESEKIPSQYYITNVNGTMNVINHIASKNFIFASTGAASLCDNTYGLSKRIAEDIVHEYYTHKQIDYTIFRFYNVTGTSGYSPTNVDGLMYNLLQSYNSKQFTIFGNDYDTIDGTCIRDYVHVDEICNSIIKAIDKPSNTIECLGHGTGHSVLEMFNMFKNLNNLDIELKTGPRRKGDSPILVLDSVSEYMEQLYSFEDYLKL